MLQVSVLRLMLGRGGGSSTIQLVSTEQLWTPGITQEAVWGRNTTCSIPLPIFKGSKKPPLRWRRNLPAGGEGWYLPSHRWLEVIPNCSGPWKLFNWCRNWIRPFLSLFQFHQRSRTFHGIRSFHDNLWPAWVIVSLCFSEEVPFCGQKFRRYLWVRERDLPSLSQTQSVLLLWIAVVDNGSGRQLAYLHFYGMLIISSPSGKDRQVQIELTPVNQLLFL